MAGGARAHLGLIQALGLRPQPALPTLPTAQITAVTFRFFPPDSNVQAGSPFRAVRQAPAGLQSGVSAFPRPRARRQSQLGTHRAAASFPLVTRCLRAGEASCDSPRLRAVGHPVCLIAQFPSVPSVSESLCAERTSWCRRPGPLPSLQSVIGEYLLSQR